MRNRILLLSVLFAVVFTANLWAEESAPVVVDKPQPEVNASTSEQSPAPPQKPKKAKPKLTLKPSAEVFWPRSDYIKKNFGDSWISFGLSVGFKGADKSKPGLNYKAEAIMRRSNSARFYLIPIGVSYTIRPKHNDKKVVPYFGGAANISIIKIDDKVNGIDTGFKATPSATIFTGINIGKHMNIEANYYAVSKVSDLDLSGLGIQFTYVL